MASILRQIVAGPRQKHPEAGLDLCYVTDNIIATSGPSSTFPQKAYRNPTDSLVKFLDYKHDTNWAIWEFRAEGTGYPDSEVYGRIRHYPWPDHHPPPFALVPNIMASMRDWLKGPDTKVGRVVVVHCKAGKGRSGTIACSYLISEEGWTVEDALFRFTTRRMRSGFGPGVSIPSQLRWIKYVDNWTKHGKIYVERQIEVLEVHVWGLRAGVKVSVESYIDDGRTIKNFHTFHRHERVVLGGSEPTSAICPTSNSDNFLPLSDAKVQPSTFQQGNIDDSLDAGADAVIFRPSHPIILPTSDINIDLERRNQAAYGWTMVTSVAHVWFNPFFEGHGPQNDGNADTSGVFEIAWDAMDGIKGSARKGTRSLDRLAVVWRAVDSEGGNTGLVEVVTEPKEGAPVPEMKAADWKSAGRPGLAAVGKDLGLRTESPASVAVSKASSLKSSGTSSVAREEDSLAGVKTHGPDEEDFAGHEAALQRPTVRVSNSDLRKEEAASPEAAAHNAEGFVLDDNGLGNIVGVVKFKTDDQSHQKTR